MKTKEPVWRRQARKALGAMIDHDASKAEAHLIEMLRMGQSSVIIEACLLWIDELFSIVPPPPNAYVPDEMPANIPNLVEADMWAMRLIAARANDDQAAGEALFAEAAQDWDSVVERLVHLLALVAMKLESPLG